MSNKANASGAGRDTSVTDLSGEGASYAEAYLARMQAGTAQPGELAVIVAFLQGEMLHAACRVIERALGGRHG